jgi:hypothetical protein
MTDEPLTLEPRQRGVHRADHDLASGAFGDFLPDSDAVRFVTEAIEGEHDVQLELSEEVTLGHISYTNAYFDGEGAGKVASGLGCEGRSCGPARPVVSWRRLTGQQRGALSIVSRVIAVVSATIAAILAIYCVALVYAAATFEHDSLPGPAVLSMVAVGVGLAALLCGGLALVLWKRSR